MVASVGVPVEISQWIGPAIGMLIWHLVPAQGNALNDSCIMFAWIVSRPESLMHGATRRTRCTRCHGVRGFQRYQEGRGLRSVCSCRSVYTRLVCGGVSL
jgi:hypothetical protein